MASRRDSQPFLSHAERAKLLKDIRPKQRRRRQQQQQQQQHNKQHQHRHHSGGYSSSAKQDACNVCLEDTDHANLLICDKCDGQYHTYCLPVPLERIPESDWYCDACEHFKYIWASAGTRGGGNDDDGLEQIVSSMPPSYTERFGEICWAQGGTGYGMWPACIYDPRLTEPKTRLHAKRQVGKKHLVYFFQCPGTPFDLLATDKLVNWEEGMADGFYQGRTAKAVGKRRFVRFQEALQAAIIEEGKPISRRLEWNTTSTSTSSTRTGNSPAQPRFLPSPVMAVSPCRNKKKRRSRPNKDEKEKKESLSKRARSALDFGGNNNNHKEAAPQQSSSGSATSNAAAEQQASTSSHRAEVRAPAPQPTTTTGMDVVDENITASAAAPPPEEEDNELFCQVYLTEKAVSGGGGQQQQPGTCVGFVVLPSFAVTFADARTVINDTLETEKFPSEWRFVHPSLGPVSIKLESKLGSMMSSLIKGSRKKGGGDIGTGSLEDPAKITIMADPLSKL